MASLKIVSRDEFAGLRWRPVTNYQFTVKDSFCQLVLQELATACLHTPLLPKQHVAHLGLRMC